MAVGGYIDVKCRVNGALEKLKDCFEELHGIMIDGSSSERSDLLSTVRETLGALETGLKTANQEESELRSKPMRSRRSAGPEICAHTCVHHPEIVNPRLWGKLTEDLVALVFARLPIPRIIELRKSSAPWAAMSESASFKGAFTEANPKLFGLLGWGDDPGADFRTWILDAALKEWHGFRLEFPKGKGYRDSFPLGNGFLDSMYACDGGLVCFVPEWDDVECFDCVFVGNPLTDTWRKLPDIWGSFRYQDPVLVQLVTNELFYRVILVCCEKLRSQDAETHGAFVYDSRTGSWSVMRSGLVYGTGNSIRGMRHYPLVFDCATKQLIELHLSSCAALQDLEGLQCSILKDHVLVLHALIDPDDDTERYVISEFTWESSRSDMRKVADYEVALRDLVGREDVEIFTSNGLILSTWTSESENATLRQLTSIYDVSAGRWRDLPPLISDPAIRDEKLLDGLFMCELRWDADP